MQPTKPSFHFTSIIQQPDPVQVQQTVSNILSQPKSCQQTFQFSQVTQAEVKHAFLTIKSNAAGIDNISLKLISPIIDIILPALTHLFNASLSTGVFPSIWKTALVKPIPKTNKPVNFNDLRPISLLPLLSKALERIVFNQVNQHLSDNQLTDVLQSGFKKGCSTTTAMVKIIDDISKAIDHNQSSILCLLDLSKAFDSINLDVMLARLHQLNFNPSALNWFKTYLMDRKQVLEIQQNQSQPNLIKSGIPQGAILGPLMFSIYLRPLPNCLKNCFYHIFADDVQIYLPFKKEEFTEAIENFNSDLSNIVSWCQENFLSIHPDKCKALLIGSPNSINTLQLNDGTQGHTLSISNTPITFEKKFVKDLGFMIDPLLNWHEQTKFTCKKVFASLHTLNRFRHIFPFRLKAKIVQTLVLPLFDYGDIIYNSCRDVDAKRLQYTQNCCIRFIFRARKSAHVTPFYKQLNWLKLSQRRDIHSITLLHKIIHNNSAGYLHVTRLNTERNGIQLNIVRHRTSLYDSTFFISILRKWNALPREIRDIINLNKFKRELKKHFLESQ